MGSASSPLRWSAAAWLSFALSLGIVVAFWGFFQFKYAQARHEAHARSVRLLLTGANAMRLAANESTEWLLDHPGCKNGVSIATPPAEAKAEAKATPLAPGFVANAPPSPTTKPDLPCIRYEQMLAFIPRSQQQFDKTLLVTGDGGVLHQSTSPVAPTLSSLKQLKKVGSDKKPTSEPLSLDGMASSVLVEAGDAPYQLFCTPLTADTTTGPNQTTRLRFCGLIADERLIAQCLAVSPLYLLALGGLLALVLLLPPFVRTMLLSRSERLRFFDAFTVGVCLFFWLMLAALFGVHFHWHEKLAGEARARLEDLARVAASGLESDLERSKGVLGGVEREVVERLLPPFVAPPQLPLPQQPGPGAPISIEAVAWADSGGRQLAKWVRPRTSDAVQKLEPSAQLLDVSTRDYFKRALRAKGEIVEDSIKTYTSGQSRAVLAKALSTKAGSGVLTITGALPSLFGAKLARGVGFAVADRDGRVVLHSEEALSNSHNILDETESNPQLTQLLLEPQPKGYVHHLRYWGVDHSAAVHPVTERWAVVAFEESEPRRLVIFRSATQAVIYSGLYTLCAVGFLALYLWSKSRQMPHCWPDRRRWKTYWVLAGACLSCASLFGYLQWLGQSDPVYRELGTWGSLGIPLLLGLAAIALFHREPEPEDEAPRLAWYKRHLLSYPLACGLFWIVGTTLPAIAIGNLTASETAELQREATSSAWQASKRALHESSGDTYELQRAHYQLTSTVDGHDHSPRRAVVVVIFLASLPMIILIVFWALDTLFLWGVEAASPTSRRPEERPLWLLVAGPRTHQASSTEELFPGSYYVEQRDALTQALIADPTIVQRLVVLSPRQPADLLSGEPKNLSDEARSAWRRLVATLSIRSYRASDPPSAGEAQKLARGLLDLDDRACTTMTGFSWLCEELRTDTEVYECCKRNLPLGSLAATELMELKRRVRDACSDYYDELWQSCTELEKLTLLQLAQEGFINPRRLELIRALMSRGLVVRRPMLAPLSDGFALFVCARGSAESLTHLEVSEGFSWQHLRPPMIALLVCSAGAFFYTQRALFDSTVVFATTLTGILAQVGTWLSALGFNPAARLADASRSMTT